MYHIAALLLSFIHRNFIKLIEDGRIYIAMSPLYRINKNGKYIYFKNDKEYDKYLVKEISETYDLKDIKMKDFIQNGKKFVQKFDQVRYKYNIDSSVLNILENHYKVTGTVTSDDAFEELKEKELEITKESNYYQVSGLVGNSWHNFKIDSDFLKDIDSLSKTYALDIVDIINKKDKSTVNDMYIYDAYHKLSSSVKFERKRFKGIGEANADELFDTTLDPKKRDILQVQLNDFDKSGNLNELFFDKNKANLRKEFILENL
ncbi:DNA-gyrase B-subunit [Bacillus phage vB_BpuM-BpSp]|nr:DNA-gyrase B-subunit [Bacillus phage vB_BpuM-BpSp]